jgi:rhodanese-related sulfurtransferase
VLWVDARAAADYDQRHVPGAIRLNQGEWDQLFPLFLDGWRPGVRVVVYCNFQTCDASRGVALRLQRSLEPSTVYVLKGGWSSWLEANP